MIPYQFVIAQMYNGYERKRQLLGEASLAMMSYNLVRLMNIYSMDKLRKQLKRCFLIIFASRTDLKPFEGLKIFEKFLPCWGKMKLKIA